MKHLFLIFFFAFGLGQLAGVSPYDPNCPDVLPAYTENWWTLEDQTAICPDDPSFQEVPDACTEEGCIFLLMDDDELIIPQLKRFMKKRQYNTLTPNNSTANSTITPNNSTVPSTPNSTTTPNNSTPSETPVSGNATPTVAPLPTSKFCYYVLGPKANQVENFPDATAVVVGSLCKDAGGNNKGFVVPSANPKGSFNVTVNGTKDIPSCVDIIGVNVPFEDKENIGLKAGLATTTTYPTGDPIIYIKTSYRKNFSRVTLKNLYAHECAHHALGQVRAAIILGWTSLPWRLELNADCFGIQELIRLKNVTQRDVTTILNSLGRIPGDGITNLDGPLRKAALLKECNMVFPK